MSRYDGLIIPRSYSEYINKTDAATLLQALQLSGVMDAVPTAGSNHPVKSSGLVPTNVVASGNNTPVISDAVYNAIKTKHKETLRIDNFSVNADSTTIINISSLNINSPYIAFIYNRSNANGLVLTGDGYGSLLVYNTSGVNFSNIRIELCFIW